MRSRFKSLIIILVALLIPISMAGCSSGMDGRAISAYYFGSELYIAIYSDFNLNENVSKFEDFTSEVKLLASEIEKSISLSEPDSYINKFNDADAGSTVKIDKHTYELILKSQALSVSLNGSYDPTSHHLVDLWGFTPRFDASYSPSQPYDRADYKNELPQQKYIDAFKSLVGVDKLELYVENDEYYVKKPNILQTVDGVSYTMALNFGGAGKGYACDLITELAVSAGYEYGYISVGQSSIALLKNPNGEDEQWTTSITSPVVGGGNYAEISLKDKSLSTSGDYYRYYEIDGVRYGHIIDPITGYPTKSSVAIATVVSESALTADVYSTALCVSGESLAVKLASASDIEYIMLKSSNNGYQLVTNMDSDSYLLSGAIEL